MGSPETPSTWICMRGGWTFSLIRARVCGSRVPGPGWCRTGVSKKDLLATSPTPILPDAEQPEACYPPGFSRTPWKVWTGAIRASHKKCLQSVPRILPAVQAGSRRSPRGSHEQQGNFRANPARASRQRPVCHVSTPRSARRWTLRVQTIALVLMNGVETPGWSLFLPQDVVSHGMECWTGTTESSRDS